MSRSSASQLIILGFLCAVLGSPTRGASQQFPSVDPPYIPTPGHLVDAMLEMGRVTADDVVYDLGSGDGRIVIAAALRGARGVGIEYDDGLVRRSRAAADSAGIIDLVEFRSEDLFETDLREATVVLMYLSADFNLRLRPRLLAELKPGSRVVSHAFHLGEWRPTASRTIGSGAARATLFSWIVPADVDGFWVLQIDRAGALSLELTQRFQELRGEVRRNGRALPVDRGEMSGDTIRFRIRQRVAGQEAVFDFEGLVADGSLEGTVQGPREWGTRDWSAVRGGDPSLAPQQP